MYNFQNIRKSSPATTASMFTHFKTIQKKSLFSSYSDEFTTGRPRPSKFGHMANQQQDYVQKSIVNEIRGKYFSYKSKNIEYSRARHKLPVTQNN